MDDVENPHHEGEDADAVLKGIIAFAVRDEAKGDDAPEAKKNQREENDVHGVHERERLDKERRDVFPDRSGTAEKEIEAGRENPGHRNRDAQGVFARLGREIPELLAAARSDDFLAKGSEPLAHADEEIAEEEQNGFQDIPNREADAGKQGDMRLEIDALLLGFLLRTEEGFMNEAVSHREQGDR